MLVELLALFVDDGSLVLGVIAWVAVTVLGLRSQILDPVPIAVLLALGIGVLLAGNVAYAARAHGSLAH
jgi:hypothetical protein